MDKQIVFLSHIHDEREVAVAFKELVEQAFLGLIDVFVSSDGHSITMGQRWLDEVTEALSKCEVEVVVASPFSVGRPWVNFEAGAGWVRKIPVIPLCHSGMVPNQLPVPLNLLQASSATDVPGLRAVFATLALALRSAVPSVDFQPFIDRVRAFEEDYTFWSKCRASLASLQAILADNFPAALRAWCGGQYVEFNLPDTMLHKAEIACAFLRSESILAIIRTGSTMLASPGGMLLGCRITPMPRFAEVAVDPRFPYCL